MISRRRNGQVVIEHCVSEIGLGTTICWPVEDRDEPMEIVHGLETMQSSELACAKRARTTVETIGNHVGWTRTNPGPWEPEGFIHGALQMTRIQGFIARHTKERGSKSTGPRGIAEAIRELEKHR